MAILVVNCSHWIGYHVVESLLDAGYNVDGIPLQDESDDLLMFFGRNSLFTLAKTNQRKTYDLSIIVGDDTEIKNFNIKRKVVINAKQEIEKREGNSVIHYPWLFGEWMPMKADGCYIGNDFFPFDSNDFKENAVYIKDFTESLLEWIKLAKLPQENEAKSSNKNEVQSLEDFIYFRDNSDMEKQLKKVIKHYQAHKSFYK